MKRCPQCGREYDNSMMFCLDDGAELLYGPASADEPQTAIFPGGQASFGETVSEQSISSGSFANSIAVLPFANISADAENEYFCDGLSEEILNALTKIEKLKVAARTSAFSFKGKDATVGDIARSLNVNTVLEGSVRRSGDRLRVTAQLISAADGYHLWSERYDREMKDVFDVQDEITLAVVEALKVRLVGNEQAAVLKRYTHEPEALEFYLRGLSYFTRFTPEYFRKAIESFEKAIAIDPGYSAAYAGLAESYSEMSFFTSPGEWMPKAKEAARKALELDDGLGRSHNALAVVRMYYDRDYAGAEAEFKRAIGLDPGSAHIHMWYGWFLGLTRRFDEGLVEMGKARELDPLSPLIGFGTGAILLWSGRTDPAIEELAREVELNPAFPLGYHYLAEAYLVKGDISSAIATIENPSLTGDDPFTQTARAHVYSAAGQRERVMELLKNIEQMAAEGYELTVQIAQVHVGLGDHEAALEWLEKGFDEHSVWPIWMGVDPAFYPLRSDRRFKDLLKRMNLPE